jgi:hypothetical protein
MPAPPTRRPPLPVRIAVWRRRIVAGSLALFAAAWIAVAGLGRQPGTAAANRPTTTSADSTQSGSSSAGSGSASASGSASESDSSGSSDSTGSAGQSDLSAPTTRQS